MGMTKLRLLAAFVSLAAVSALSSWGQTPAAAATASSATTSTGPTRIVFLHINDTHGKIQGTGAAGGEPRLATLVQDARQDTQAARVFLLHSGDILSRGDEMTRQTLGAANFLIMNYLKFDAWTPGNGDFYDGIDVLQKRIAQAKFPTLAANVKVKADGKPLAKPYIIEKAGDVRVAFFGLCFIRLEQEGGAAFILEDPVQTAAKLVPELRKQADVVVAMTHIGIIDDLVLAQEVPGIDVILGAHSHTVIPDAKPTKRKDGSSVLICQAGMELAYMGVATLELVKTESGYKIVSAADKLIPLGQNVKIDPKMVAFIAKIAEVTSSRPAAQPQPMGAAQK
jgi:2',3'-cyclic-nucleotide 2'-phosphodiesterase (5'-nucleotidase family)